MAGGKLWPIRRNALFIVWTVTFLSEPDWDSRTAGCESSSVPGCDNLVLVMGRTLSTMFLELVLSNIHTTSKLEEAVVGGLTALMALHIPEIIMSKLAWGFLETLLVFTLFLGALGIACFGWMVYEKVLDFPPEIKTGPYGLDDPGNPGPWPATPRILTSRLLSAHAPAPPSEPIPLAFTTGNKKSPPPAPPTEEPPSEPAHHASASSNRMSPPASPVEEPRPAIHSLRQLRFTTTLPSETVRSSGEQKWQVDYDDDDSALYEKTESSTSNPPSEESFVSPPAEPQPKIVMYLSPFERKAKRKVSTRGVKKKSIVKSRKR